MNDMSHASVMDTRREDRISVMLDREDKLRNGVGAGQPAE